MRAAIFPRTKPEEHQPHFVFARLLDDGVNDRRVELARFRFELFPIDRNLQRVRVEIINRRPDLGQHRRPAAGIVALRAENQKRCTVHNQRMTSVLRHQMRQRVVVGLRRRDSHAQTGQENDAGNALELMKRKMAVLFASALGIHVAQRKWRWESVKTAKFPVAPLFEILISSKTPHCVYQSFQFILNP